MKWIFLITVLWTPKILAHSDKKQMFFLLLKGSSAQEVQALAKLRQRFVRLEKQCHSEMKRSYFPIGCYKLNSEKYRWGMISSKEKEERERFLDLSCQKFVTQSQHPSNEIYDFPLKNLSKKCRLLVKEKKSRLEYMYGDAQSYRTWSDSRVY